MVGATLRWMEHHSQLQPSAGDALIVGCSSTEQLQQSIEGMQGGPLPEGVLQAFEQAYGLVKGAQPYYSRVGGQVGTWARL
jgi:aflatoxin B1 aldehyde reductase